MSSAPEKKPEADVIYVGADDLPIYCPGPKSPLWSMHPRIYIEIAHAGVAKCPYCSAAYALREGEKIHGH